MGRVEDRFRDALEQVTLAELARGTSRSRSSWEKYKDGRLPITLGAARELAAYLKARSAELAEAADALEAAVADEGGHDA
jgi:hypothetical protein